MKKLFLLIVLTLFITPVLATQDGEKGSGSINTFQITWDASKHALTNTHFKIIGACFWYHSYLGVPYDVYPTLEIDEYLPDLVVSVFNGNGTDPYTEFNATVDKVDQAIGKESLSMLTGFDFYENGQVDSSAIKSKI